MKTRHSQINIFFFFFKEQTNLQEYKSVVASGRGKGLTKEGHRRIFWSDGNDLCISCSAVYMGSYLCQGSSDSSLKIYVLYCSCGSWALEFRAQQLGCMGLVAPQHVGSSQTRDHTHVFSIAKQILIHQGSPWMELFSKETFTSYSRRKARCRNKKVVEWLYGYLWFDKSDSGLP